MPKSAVIIGGSNAGLMHGIMLKHHGYDVTILEKDPSALREGYDAGISLGSDIEEFLKRHDKVKQDMVVVCTPSVKISVEGKPKLEHKQTMICTSWGLFVSILRANFDGTTSKAVPKAPKAAEGDGRAEFRKGARVVDLKDRGDRVQVEFEDVNTGNNESLLADIVIVADGSNSSMRARLMPGVKRKYAGYMCWRGTVPEHLISEEYNKRYAEKMTFHFMTRNYILNYTIPTDDGQLEPGKRLHNWVWYHNLAEDSAEMKDTFTDINGTTHFSTVPRGLVRPEPWEKQKARTSDLPEGLADIVRKTKKPFATKVYEVNAPKALFFGGKVFLVGDAQCTLRPNVAKSTMHAAHDCNTLEKVIEGNMSLTQWERAVLRWCAAQRRFGLAVAAYGLGTKFSVLWHGCCWLLLLLAQKIGIA